MTPWQALHFLGGWRCWNGGAKPGLSYEDLWLVAYGRQRET